MKVLIIEDEARAANHLERVINEVAPEMQVLWKIETVRESVEFLLNNNPELIFSDVQLADGLSFEIYEQVEVNCPIIFTTAYDQYAIEAFKVNSIDYLLKPIDFDALSNALKKLENWQNQMSNTSVNLSNQQLESLLNLSQQNTAIKSRFMVKTGDKLHFIKTEEIACFYAEDNEVFLHTFSNKRYIIDYSLDNLNGMIDLKLFHRLNRKFMVQKNAISGVHKYFNSRLKIELNINCNDEILISRVKVPDFLNWMEQ